MAVLLVVWVWFGALHAGNDNIPATAYFVVKGMTCGSCEVKIKKALRHYEGVIKVDAVYQSGLARVVYDDERIEDPSVLADAISEAGFTAKLLDAKAGERRWNQRASIPKKKRGCCANKKKGSCAQKDKKGCASKAKSGCGAGK